MSQEYSESELESLIAAAAPQPVASQWLKLQILREARREKQRYQARIHFFGMVAACLLLFVFTEARLHTVSHLSQDIALYYSPETKSDSGTLCQFKVNAEVIGSWGHVEAMMNYRSQLSETLRPVSPVALSASL